MQDQITRTGALLDSASFLEALGRDSMRSEYLNTNHGMSELDAEIYLHVHSRFADRLHLDGWDEYGLEVALNNDIDSLNS